MAAPTPANTVNCGSGVSGVSTGTGAGDGSRRWNDRPWRRCDHGLRADVSELRAVFVRVPRPGRGSAAGRCAPARCLVREPLRQGSASKSGHRRGVVRHRPGARAPATRSRRCGAQAASELQLSQPVAGTQPVEQRLREPGRMALDRSLDLASPHHHGAGLQRRWVHDRDGHGHACRTSRGTPATDRPSPVTAPAPSTTRPTGRRPVDRLLAHLHETSAGQPSPDGNPNDAAFPITATVTWSVAWAGPDGSAGALPSLTTEGTSP